MLGDIIANMGKETWTRTVVGTCGLHEESNDNSTRLINYAVHHHTVIGGLLLPHRNIH
jgi:hypothetical protein